MLRNCIWNNDASYNHLWLRYERNKISRIFWLFRIPQLPCLFVPSFSFHITIRNLLWSRQWFSSWVYGVNEKGKVFALVQQSGSWGTQTVTSRHTLGRKWTRCDRVNDGRNIQVGVFGVGSQERTFDLSPCRVKRNSPYGVAMGSRPLSQGKSKVKTQVGGQQGWQQNWWAAEIDRSCRAPWPWWGVWILF